MYRSGGKSIIEKPFGIQSGEYSSIHTRIKHLLCRCTIRIIWIDCQLKCVLKNEQMISFILKENRNDLNDDGHLPIFSSLSFFRLWQKGDVEDPKGKIVEYHYGNDADLFKH